jgi:EAL domain-containing protein (putative c-di-GMP-specific phosphodiesterase class I)
MLSRTPARATPRVLLAPAPEPQRAYARLSAACPPPRTSSPAGLHGRPWLGRLRRALREQRFVIHYQPIVSLRDGRIAHHEALLRLADRPGGRLVAPGAFLPAAERYGLIREIDHMVVDRVVARLAGRGSEAVVAVNLSALSVSDEAMLGHLAERLRSHGVSPAQLVLEVTETASISDMAQAQRFCAGAKALGCAVALDDFGAGFGAFAYLKQLPFDYLKIDGGFISRLPRSPHDQLVVKALVDVARGMGRRTIAEFVTDADTLALLRGFGVDYAQGFALGRPRPRMSPPGELVACAAV